MCVSKSYNKKICLFMKAVGLADEEKIWCQYEKGNTLVDCTKGGKNLDEIDLPGRSSLSVKLSGVLSCL